MTQSVFGRLFRCVATTAAALVAATMVVSGCTPETSLDDVACEGDADCEQPGTACEDGYCVVVDDRDARLTVDIVGLPAEMDAEVTVEGPEGFEQTLSRTETLGELFAGSYEVTAERVDDGEGRLFDPDEPEESVEIDVSGHGEATVEYDVVTGSVQVDATGLPGGAESSVELISAIGDTNYQVQVGELLEDVEPGGYTVVPHDYHDGEASYVANETEIEVESERTTTEELEYLKDPGSVQVLTRGLPPELEGELKLVGDEDVELPFDGRLDAVAPGSYTLEADEIDDDDGFARYVAAGLQIDGEDAGVGDEIIVASGQQTELVVDYEALPGEVTVELGGLDEDDPDVDVELQRADGQGSVEVEEFGSPIEVAVGSYIVIPSDYEPDPGHVYAAETEVITVGSEDELEVTVGYELVPGEVNLVVDGPFSSSVAPQLVLEGDENYEIVGSGAIHGVEPGEYTLQAPQVEEGLASYNSENDGETIVVQSDSDANVTVVYEVVFAEALTVEISGLDADIDAQVVVDGPSVASDTIVEHSKTYDDELEPGEYTIEPQSVQDDDGTSYHASSQTVGVASGESAQVDVEYTSDEGAVAVGISGLDDGVDAEVVFEHTDTGDKTEFTGTETRLVPPGDYTIDVRDVEEDPALFTGDGPADVTVITGETVPVDIEYTVESGRLELSSELEDDETEQIGVYAFVEDADGVVQTAQASQNDTTLEQLDPGEYTVEFQRIDDGTISYEPIDDDADSKDVTVKSDGIADEFASAHADYRYVTGAVQVSVEGLDGAAEPTIELHDDDGDTGESISGEERFEDVVPGSYTVVATDYPEDDAEYTADDVAVEVQSDVTADVTVEYELLTGNIEVVVEQLDGLYGKAEIFEGDDVADGDAPVDTVVTDGSANSADLAPGEYTVVFDEVEDDATSNLYRVPDADNEVTVDVGADDTEQVTGSYESVDGTLVVEVEVPDEDSAGGDIQGAPTFAITATDGGSDSDSFEVTAGGIDKQFELAPGDYQISYDAGELTDQWGNEFHLDDIETTGLEVTSQIEESHEASLRLPNEVFRSGDDGDRGELRQVFGDITEDTEEIVFDVEEVQLDDELVIDRPIDLLGEDIGITSDDENNDHRLLAVDFAGDAGDEIVLQGLTLEGGHADLGGAVVVDVEEADVTFIDVDFDDNSGEDKGGALYVHDPQGGESELYLDGVTFSDNAADEGGAVYAEAGTDLTFEQAEFDGNEASADNGGAVVVRGEVSFEEAHFHDNVADEGDGGAMYVAAGASAEISKALFEANEAPAANQKGGAVYVEDGSLSVENSTFTGNEVHDNNGEGGALAFGSDGSDAELLHSTVVGNVAGTGGGIWSDDNEEIEIRSSYVNDNTDGGNADYDIATEQAQQSRVQSDGFNFVGEVDTSWQDGSYSDEDGDKINEASSYDETLSEEGGFTEVHVLDEEFDGDPNPGYLDIPADRCVDFDDELVVEDQRGEPRPYPGDDGWFCTRGAWEVN